MATEPEPKSTGQSNNSSFSVENQLSTFRSELDGPVRPTRTIPGFLFRDGRSRKFQTLYEPEMAAPKNDPWAKETPWYKASMAKAQERQDKIAQIDQDLLDQHKDTYEEARKIRREVLDRIKPAEILEMVRNVWGRGEISVIRDGWDGGFGNFIKISDDDLGSTLTYVYPLVNKEYSRVGGGYVQRNLGAYSWQGPEFEYRSGSPIFAWVSKPAYIIENIAVIFGNEKFPSRDTNALDQFFADRYLQTTYNGNAPFVPEIDLFKGLPRTIWRRPDNLGIKVTIPYAWVYGPFKMKKAEYDLSYHGSTEEITVVGYLPTTSSRFLGTGMDRSPASQWFDLSATQQEIMDFLSQHLEEQRAKGLLPPQMETVELAKIEELKKRGLL